MTPGAVLSSARKAAGLSVADVAAQLRLSPRQIEALEGDRYADLPGPVFVRGFIRNYARVLKLDPVPLLHALGPELNEEAPLRVRETSGTLPISARRDHARPLLILFCTILVAVLAAGGYELWSRQKEQKPQVADAAASRATRSAVAPPEKSQQPTPAVEASTPSEPAHQSTAPADNPPLAAAQSEPASPSPADARMARLRVQFTTDSWLEVRDREGAVIFSGTGSAGSERTLEARAPLAVVIGNAGGVRITYNDRALDLSAFAARNIARFTLE